MTGSRRISWSMYQGDVIDKTVLRIIIIKKKDLQWVQEVLVVPVVQYYLADPERRR